MLEQVEQFHNKRLKLTKKVEYHAKKHDKLLDKISKLKQEANSYLADYLEHNWQTITPEQASEVLNSYADNLRYQIKDRLELIAQGFKLYGYFIDSYYDPFYNNFEHKKQYSICKGYAIYPCAQSQLRIHRRSLFPSFSDLNSKAVYPCCYAESLELLANQLLSSKDDGFIAFGYDITNKLATNNLNLNEEYQLCG